MFERAAVRAGAAGGLKMPLMLALRLMARALANAAAVADSNFFTAATTLALFAGTAVPARALWSVPAGQRRRLFSAGALAF